MSTLNISETKGLQDARSRISSVRARLRKSVEAADGDRNAIIAFGLSDVESMVAALTFADDHVKTVVTMKGHYPK